MWSLDFGHLIKMNVIIVVNNKREPKFYLDGTLKLSNFPMSNNGIDKRQINRERCHIFNSDKSGEIIKKKSIEHG